MSKSAVQVAQEALAAGQAALPEYGSPFSRRDYTQPQLFALLILRQFLRTDYRGVVTLVAEWSELRGALGLAKVPHFSTLVHASRRLLAGAEAGGLTAVPKQQWSSARKRGPIDAAPVAAVGATGLETRHVSAYFGERRAKGRSRGKGHKGHRQRAWPKLTVVVHAHSHLGECFPRTLRLACGCAKAWKASAHHTRPQISLMGRSHLGEHDRMRVLSVVRVPRLVA